MGGGRIHQGLERLRSGSLMATIQVHKKYAFKWYEKFYFMSISAGMWVTLKHFLKSAFLRRMVTVSYPEKKLPLSSRFRGLHRLKRNEKGQERCTACYCRHCDSRWIG